MDDSLKVTSKLMGIATIRTATEHTTKIYSDVKDRNFIFRTWSWTAETGFMMVSVVVRPLARTLNGPIKVADSVACTIVDVAQRKFPIISETPENILKTSCETIAKTSCAQLAMSGADKLLFIGEKMVTLLPEFSVDEIETEDKKCKKQVEDHVSTIMGQIKSVYGTVTMPLKITEMLIKESRKTLQKYKRETPVKMESKPPGIIQRLAHLPLKGLHFIGMLAEKRSILYRQRHTELKVEQDICNKELEFVEKQFSKMECHEDQILEESSDTDSIEIETESFDSPLSTRASSQTSPTEFYSASEVKTKTNRLTPKKPTPKIVKPIVTPLRKKAPQKKEGFQKPNASTNVKMAVKPPPAHKDLSSRKGRSSSDVQRRSDPIQTKPARPKPRVGSE